MSRVAEGLRSATKLLAVASDTARLDAELLLAEALQISRSNMLLDLNDLSIPPEFAEMLERRLQHEPIAYILGHQEFYGRTFRVSPDVLIPRADSETLIDLALQNYPKAKRILDLGTGSGALLLTLIAEIPDAVGIGIDTSLGAVAVAASNAAHLGVEDRAHIRRSDWADSEWREGLGQFDLIISNPPYVETHAALEKTVSDFEPMSALFAGPDGLDDYAILIPQLRDLLTDNGAAILEIGHQQDISVTALAREGGFSVTLHRDLAHRPRALLLR